jgi:hypothetical protein
MQFYSLAGVPLDAESHSLGLSSSFCRHLQTDLSGMKRLVHLWHRRVHLASCLIFSTFVPWAFQRGRSHSEIDKEIWTVAWGGDSMGFRYSKSCLSFCAVVRSYIVQMDHDASERFPRLTWQTCSTRSGTADSTKKVALYFMPFGTYNRLVIPLPRQIIEMR